MPTAATPHNFLLHLRTRAPALARRMDGLSGMERGTKCLILRAPEEGWALAELRARREELIREVVSFFGAGWECRVDASAPDPQALPLPALTSKAWNHLAFLAGDLAAPSVLAVPKPIYREEWLPRWREAGSPEDWMPPSEEAAFRQYKPAAEIDGLRVVPDILDDLAGLARANASYAHLIALFPGDEMAELWESRLYATKEWGTATTSSPILHKYVGRLHYVGPLGPVAGVLGLRIARTLSGG